MTYSCPLFEGKMELTKRKGEQRWNRNLISPLKFHHLPKMCIRDRYKLVKSMGGRIVIKGASKQNLRVMQLAGMSKIVDFEED